MTRHLLISAAMALTLSAHAAAPVIPANAVDQLRPYLQVPTVEGEETTVRAYFSPACPYSRQYLSFYQNLAKTLPHDLSWAYTPVVNKGDGLTYAIAFAAVQRFYPRHLSRFVEASLLGVQEHGLSTKNWFGIERISRAAGIPVPMGRLVEDNLPILQQDVEHLMTVQRKMKITNTPSVGIAGTYIVTPEFTGGDSGQFSTLLNAVITMVTIHR